MTAAGCWVLCHQWSPALPAAHSASHPRPLLLLQLLLAMRRCLPLLPAALPMVPTGWSLLLLRSTQLTQSLQAAALLQQPALLLPAALPPPLPPRLLPLFLPPPPLLLQ